NAEANIVSMDNTGFTLNWSTNTDSTAKQIIYLALGDLRNSNLIIKEQTRPTSTTSFSYLFGILPFTLEDNGTNQQYPDTKIFQNVAPGTYSVSQGANANYITTSSCDNGNPASSIQIGNNQTITCKFVNTKPSTIKIVEKTIGQGSTVFQ